MSVFQNVTDFFFYDREAILVFYGNQKRIYLFLLERRKITWKGESLVPQQQGLLLQRAVLLWTLKEQDPYYRDDVIPP